MDGSELTKPVGCIASSTDTPPQTARNPTTEPHTTLPSAHLAKESCRATVSIDTTTPVDRHPRLSETDDSAQSLQPTPIEDLCDKFSSLSSPALTLINSLDSSKSTSLDNKPRVFRKLDPLLFLQVTRRVSIDTPLSVDRHLQLPHPDLFTHRLGRRGCSSNPPPLHPHPELRQVKLLTQNKRLVRGNPLV